MALIQSEVREISGRTYTIRVLPLASARKLYHRVQALLAMSADENVQNSGAGAVMFAVLTKNITDADIDDMVQLFGPCTTVDFMDGRVLSLGGRDGVAAQDELFAGAIEDFYAWLDACVEVNFKGALAKLRGATAKLTKAVAPGA